MGGDATRRGAAGRDGMGRDGTSVVGRRTRYSPPVARSGSALPCVAGTTVPRSPLSFRARVASPDAKRAHAHTHMHCTYSRAHALQFASSAACACCAANMHARTHRDARTLPQRTQYRMSSSAATQPYRVATCVVALRTPGPEHLSCMLRVACCRLHVDWCVMHVARCVLRAAWCLLRVAWCLLRVAWCLLRVAWCTLRVASCTLRVACCNVWPDSAASRRTRCRKCVSRASSACGIAPQSATPTAPLPAAVPWAPAPRLPIGGRSGALDRLARTQPSVHPTRATSDRVGARRVPRELLSLMRVAHARRPSRDTPRRVRAREGASELSAARRCRPPG
jgi:hypothetical protein